MNDACTSERGPFGVSTPPSGRTGRRTSPLTDGKTFSTSRSLEPIMSGIPFAAVEEALLDFVSDSTEDSHINIAEELVRKDTPPPLDIVPAEKPACGRNSPREGLPTLDK